MPDDAPRPAVDPLAYRRTMGRFATGVTLITTTADGVDLAMTANSLTSVSLDPVLVLICVDRTARFHEAVLASKTWAVSVLGAGPDAEAVSRHYARRGRPDADQLAAASFLRAAVTGLPVLAAAIATLECRTTAEYDGGDHTILLGEVLAVGEPDRPLVPLVWFHGRYRELPPPRPSG